MKDFSQALSEAWRLAVTLDASLLEITARSFHITSTALVAASLLAMPLGAALAILRFPGRRLLIVCSNALLGFPPVVAGLGVYVLLSRSGPLGVWGILYTPTAMVIAQTIVIFPIILTLTRQSISDLWRDSHEQMLSLGAGKWRAVPTLLVDARFSLATALCAGFGRGISEVGAVIIVGGNIDHATRVMTTAIALETSKGNLALALGLGVILMTLSLAVNAAAVTLTRLEGRHGRAFG